jgi:hypothetical protein
VTFIAEAQIEARAAEIWRTGNLDPGFDVESFLDHLDLGLSWEAVDDEDGKGDILDQLVPAERLVVLNERHLERLEAKEGSLRRFTVAHEIGHWILHSQGSGLGSSPLFDGKKVMCRDGSRDQIERQAEMFAASLLMPRDVLRKELPEGAWRGWGPVYDLARQFGVNVTPMKIRLERLQWMHLDDQEQPTSGAPPLNGQVAIF